MEYNTVFLALFIVAAGSWSSSQGAPKEPGCEFEVLDNCAADLFQFGTGPTIPATKSELESYCNKQKESEACARAYLKKCTQSLVQGIGTIFLDDVKEEIETRCNPTEEYHKNFLEHAKCFNTIGDSLHQCMRTLTLDLDAAAKLTDKNRIGGACCKFNEFESCFARSVKGKCDEEHGRVTVAKYAGELLSTVCSPYRSGEKCASIDFDPSIKGDPNVKAIITPLIKVGEALG